MGRRINKALCYGVDNAKINPEFVDRYYDENEYYNNTKVFQYFKDVEFTNIYEGLMHNKTYNFDKKLSLTDLIVFDGEFLSKGFVGFIPPLLYKTSRRSADDIDAIDFYVNGGKRLDTKIVKLEDGTLYPFSKAMCKPESVYYFFEKEKVLLEQQEIEPYIVTWFS